MRPVLTPLRSVRALMTTVVPCARKSMPARSRPALRSTSMTPLSKSGGVVSTLAVRTTWRPSSSTTRQTRSVKVPPTSVAARIVLPLMSLPSDDLDLALDGGRDLHAALAGVDVDLAADAEVREVDAGLDRGAEARQHGALLERLERVEVGPVAVDGGDAEAVAGAVLEVGTVAGLDEHGPHVRVHLMALHGRAAGETLPQELHPGVARPQHGAERAVELLARRPRVRHPGDVGVGVVAGGLAPQVEEHRVAVGEGARRGGGGRVVGVARSGPEAHDGWMARFEAALDKEPDHRRLQLVLGDRPALAATGTQQVQRHVLGLREHRRGGSVLGELLGRPGGEELAEVAGGDDLDAEGADQLDGAA